MSNLKTNAMRILEKENIPYNSYAYDSRDGLVDGITVAEKIGKSIDQVYKTLVAEGASGEYYVFIIPVSHELNLKAGAKLVGEKSIRMIKASDIRGITGYIRGGCSPIGMKKDYKTILDSSSKDMEKIIVSAGKIGYQIELDPRDLVDVVKGQFGHLL